MITGLVNSTLEPIITVFILDAQGVQHAVSATVDTGFTGFLTLPASQVQSLGLPFQTTLGGYLADGTYVDFEVYTAKVIWDGLKRPVDVQATQTTTLVGTEMLRNYSLLALIKPGGTVQIAALP